MVDVPNPTGKDLPGTTIPPSDITTVSEPDESYTLAEMRIAQTFIMSLTIGMFVVIYGAGWAIGDMFSTQKFGLFVGLPISAQIFIAGLYILVVFFILIFLTVFYRRGRNALLRTLFRPRPEKAEVEEYLPAQIITGGALVSVFAIFCGVLILFLEYLITGAQVTGFADFMGILSGGTATLFIGGVIIAFVSLIIAFLYLWRNGYLFVMQKIIRYNEKVVSGDFFTQKQRIVGRIIFSIFVICFVMIAYGIIWSILDAIIPSGKWDVFVQYPFGLQFTIIGLMASGLFGLLILAMLTYKIGNITILKALFLKIPLPKTEKDISSARIIAIGILISVFLILLAFITWLISAWVGLFTVSSGEDVFGAINSLSGGLTLLTWGLIIFIFTVLILAFIYLFNNGYSLIVQKIVSTQDKIDKSLDTAGQKVIRKKDDKPAIKKDSKPAIRKDEKPAIKKDEKPAIKK
jgi:hypothetical protein